jgi:deazaflavin-dependent oxidoreductase (nitroreductase family)
MSDELQFLYMTSTGWRSGNPHRIEIWFVEHDGRYYIVSEMGERSHWVQNVQRSPAITFEVGEQRFQGRGRVVDRSAEPTLAAAVAAKMDAKYEWSDGLIVELAPSPAASEEGTG